MTAKPRSAIREVLSLLRPYWVTLSISIALGILGGLCVTALLATIRSQANASSSPPARA